MYISLYTRRLKIFWNILRITLFSAKYSLFEKKEA